MQSWVKGQIKASSAGTGFLLLYGFYKELTRVSAKYSMQYNYYAEAICNSMSL